MNQQEFFSRYTYNVRTDKIGGGGFGTVYKAYDNILHRDVAIKVSEVKTASNGKTFSLKDEFDALKGLPKHQNIANYEELYRFEGPQGVFDYAVMQYYPEGNLSNVIKGGLTSEQKEDIAMQLLEGIGFLHAHKVVHRDLKPGNVLIVKHGGHIIPLITDFGLSKSADAGDGSMFSNSFGGGTARYSSPEQLQGKPLRFNTDLWSYGAVVYELFTSRSLFEAGSSAANTAQADLEIYNKIINGDTGDRMQDVPDRWRQVLQRCMVVNPEKRAKSAEELFKILSVTTNPSKEEKDSRPIVEDKTELEEEVNKKGIHPQPQQFDNPQPKQSDDPQPQARWRKFLPWIIAGLAVAVALVSLVMSMRMRQDNTTPEMTTIATDTPPSPKQDTIVKIQTPQNNYLPTASIVADKMNVLYAGIQNPVILSGNIEYDKMSFSFPGCNATSRGAGKHNVSVPESMIGKTVQATVAAKVGETTKTIGQTTFRVKRVPDPRAVLGANIRGGKRSKAEILANPTIRATMGDDFVYDIKWTVNSFRVIIVSKGMEDPAITCDGAQLSENAKAAIQRAPANSVVYFSDIKVSSQAGSRTLDEFSVRIR